MKSLTEKLSYIQGLCEGLELDGATKEGKVLLAIVDLLDDVTDTVSQLDSDVDQIYDEIDAIDEDLTDVEDALLYDDEDEDDEDECSCGCGHHHHDEEEDDEDLTDLYDEENPLYVLTCPYCGEEVYMDEETLFSLDEETPAYDCPHCGERIELDLEEDCDCEDCAEDEE